MAEKKTNRPKQDTQWPYIRFSEPEGAWLVDARTKNGGSRKFYKKKSDAETFAQQCRAERESNGLVGFGSAELARFGKSVHDATEFLIAHLRRLEASRPVKDVIKDFLAEKKAACNRSDRYLNDLRIRLDRFKTTFGDRMISSVTPEEINEWLAGLGVGVVTRNTFRRRLSPLFTFAKIKKWIAENPFAGGKKSDIQPIDEPRKKVKIMTNEQVRKLLDGASQECLPFWAIAIFAGLRPESELCRLQWSDVDFEQKVIIVDGDSSDVEETKTGRRVVKMSKNLLAWLRRIPKRKGPVAPQGDTWRKLRNDKRKAGFGPPGTETEEEHAAGVKLQKWTEDLTRHTYGSNHLAQHGDIGVTATQMGNSPEIVRQRYLALVKPVPAAAFWRIAPPPRKKIPRRTLAQAAPS